MRDISVVIRCYTEERWAWLVEAVASASAQTLAPREVIVVVDGNPALLARVRSELAGALVVENAGPRGSAGAWNSGIAVGEPV
jgi:glycosyltransferase involved in cell wall biosynthesis